MTLSHSPKTPAERPAALTRRAKCSWGVLPAVLVLPGVALLSIWCAQHGWTYAGGWGAPITPTTTLQEMACWHALLLLGGGWLALAPLTALIRGWRSQQPADVGREFTRAAWGMALLGILLALLVALTRVTDSELLGVYAAMLIRCIYGVPVLRLILAIFMRPRPDASPQLSPPWMVRQWSAWRLRLARRAGGYTLPLASLVLLGGCLWIVIASRITPFPLPEDLILRAVLLLAGLLVWLSLMTGIVGAVRVRQAPDALGLKTTLLALVMTLAVWALLFGVACALPASALARALPWSLRDTAQLGVAILCFVDVAFLVLGLATLPIGKHHIDTAVAADETSLWREPIPGDRLTQWFLTAGQLTSREIKQALACLWRPGRYAELEQQEVASTGGSPQRVALQIVGGGAFMVGVAVHAVAMLRLPETALLHVMRTGFPGFDLLSRLTAILVLLALPLLGLALWGRLLRWSISFSGLVALVGFAQAPFVCLMLVLAYLPARGQHPVLVATVGSLLLCWAGLYLLSNLAFHAASIARFVTEGLGLIVVLAALTWLGREAAQTAHLAALRLAGYPTTILREQLAEEAAASHRPMVHSVTQALLTPDVVAIRAADVIEHVAYQSKVMRRYYPPDEYPHEALGMRIHAELTQNARWMRRLYLPMQRATRGARTPEEAAPRVIQWLQAAVPTVDPMAFPLGEKCDQDPITTLTRQRGTEVDAAIVLVAALRAAGVAARMRAVWPDEYVQRTYALVEYYDGQHWHACYPTTRQQPQTVQPADRLALQQWCQQAPAGATVSLYMWVEGLWRPYTTDGRKSASTVRMDLQPGQYLAAYRVGDVCHVKQFVLRAATAPGAPDAAEE